MHKYEIEIKSLLGSKEKADNLVAKMKLKDPNLKISGSHKQLNHYFIDGDLQSLYEKMENLLNDDSKIKLESLARRAKDFSVRSREADGKVMLVVKVTVDDTTSENGTARIEWEHSMNLPLEELDKLILSAGFACQAKWSRERREFRYKNANVSIDKNAGYGYLAEFEMVVDDENKADEAKAVIRSIMKQLQMDELSQERLQRMFDFYNQNWRDYYGTDKTFTID